MMVYSASVITLVHAVVSDELYGSLRQEMVHLIEADVRQTARRIGKRALDERVMEAMATIPRHKFVRDKEKVYAYQNRPLPIGHGQTISQPYIVALMTDLLEVGPDASVLEIGTGSGYQAAVLSGLVKNVYSIEIIEPLGARAANRLERLGYDNVQTRIGDGYDGWEESAPFDGIMVTAAASHIPPPLLKQLKPDGRMIIPVGSPFLTQQLLLVTKDPDGKIRTRQILPVRFVPFTGKH